MGARSKVKLIQHFKKTCVYCEQDVTGRKATKDHWIPKCEGGLNGPHNYVLACFECNLKKGGTSGYTFILGTYLERNHGLLNKLKAMYMAEKKVKTIEAQLKERLNELGKSGHKHEREMFKKAKAHANQNRPAQNLQPQA